MTEQDGGESRSLVRLTTGLFLATWTWKEACFISSLVHYNG